jgi:hypothetical protein
MSSEDIRTGSQVVTDFLESLQGKDDIDAATLNAASDLFKLGKLNKIQLLKSLDALRAQAVQDDSGAHDARQP